MNQQNHLNQLQSHLAKFGLNPADWILSAASRTLYVLTHRIDREFTLIGRAQSHGEAMRWRSLSLHSI